MEFSIDLTSFTEGLIFEMEVFKVEKNILKYCGIKRHPSKRMKYFYDVLKFLNFFVFIYYVLASAFYILATRDILDIAESMTAGTTAFIMFVKFIFFCRQTEEAFGFMDEIEELNEKCKRT